MNKSILFWGAVCLLPALFTSCSSESTDNNNYGNEEEIKHIAVFSAEDVVSSEKSATTRTTGIYNGNATMTNHLLQLLILFVLQVQMLQLVTR